MGNGANKESSQTIAKSKSEKSTKSEGKKEHTPVIPPEKFEKFLRCLNDLPFEIKENQFKALADCLLTVTFNEGETILQKGKDGNGIYLVVDGFCYVRSDSEEVYRIIEDEDYFGEVSSFYHKTCSATVVCGKDGTELLLLPASVLKNFVLGPVDFPMLKWFVKRRYLDLEGTSIQNDVVFEIMKEAVENAPIFHEWSAPAVESVVRSVINDKQVIFYAAGNEIFASNEVDAHGFLLLHGNLEILSGQQQSLQILNEGPNGLWFGDEQLFCSTERDISAKAQTPCIVATFSRSNFKEIEETFPIEQAKLMGLSLRWRKLVENRDRELHDKYAGQLGLEMTRLVLRRSHLLSFAPAGMIYHIALCVTHKKVQKDQIIFSEGQKRDKMFVVFTGAVLVESDSTVSERRLEVSDIYCPTDDEPEDTVIRADVECVLGMFDVKSFKDVHDCYPDAIVTWPEAS